jgi:low affinity Fe/Cu permease
MATVDAVLRKDRRPVMVFRHRDLFTRLAGWTARTTGGRWGFLFAFGTVLVWALLGPFCGYSQTWQLVINTGTTIVTFLMVFLIQNAQNRESKAIHLKLDELILAVKSARNELIDIEHLTEEQLDLIGERYKKVAVEHQHKLEPCLSGQEKAAAIAAAAEAAHITVK